MDGVKPTKYIDSNAHSGVESDAKNEAHDNVEIQIVTANEVPSNSSIASWVHLALLSPHKNSEICVRLVDEAESKQLNQTYRQKPTSTNVLSFPAEIPENVHIDCLGDIVVCASVVKREALEQNKTFNAHWAHMIIHGTLHLQGFDHINESDANEMESLETLILTELNFPPPYEQSDEHHKPIPPKHGDK